MDDTVSGRLPFPVASPHARVWSRMTQTGLSLVWPEPAIGEKTIDARTNPCVIAYTPKSWRRDSLGSKRISRRDASIVSWQRLVMMLGTTSSSSPRPAGNRVSASRRKVVLSDNATASQCSAPSSRGSSVSYVVGGIKTPEQCVKGEVP